MDKAQPIGLDFKMCNTRVGMHCFPDTFIIHLTIFKITFIEVAFRALYHSAKPVPDS